MSLIKFHYQVKSVFSFHELDEKINNLVDTKNIRNSPFTNSGKKKFVGVITKHENEIQFKIACKVFAVQGPSAEATGRIEAISNEAIITIEIKPTRYSKNLLIIFSAFATFFALGAFFFNWTGQKLGGTNFWPTLNIVLIYLGIELFVFAFTYIPFRIEARDFKRNFLSSLRS